jgi:RNA polymerase-binding transcription factor DksA
MTAAAEACAIAVLAKAPAPAKKAVRAPVTAAKAKPVKATPPPAPKPPPKKVLHQLAPSTLAKLRERLEEERGRHRRQADDLQAEAEALSAEREQGDTQFDEESGEGDTVSVERERDLALSATARQTVDDIERALIRIDNGTYGLCVTCGDRIPLARLEVIPWAEQCVKCKARGERRR